MLCPPMHRTRCAVYQRLCHVLIQLQLYRVTRSCHHVGWSCNASRVNFAQINGLDDAVELRGVAAGVVAFHRRSRLLMFEHDTYSGSNGRLMPFISVNSNAISLNLGSTTVTTQVRSRDVTAFVI